MSPLPLRKLVKAIADPSGDHAGASLPTTSNAVRAEPAFAPNRSTAAPHANVRIRRIVPRSIAHRLHGMLLTIIGVMVMGFVIGGLARLAVHGPDPIPAWLTISIVLAGSFVG